MVWLGKDKYCKILLRRNKMLKVKKLTEKKDVDTEFWLEEHNDSILLKAKRSDQQQDFIIANICEGGMFICELDGRIAGLGFRITTKNSGLSRIRVEFL